MTSPNDLGRLAAVSKQPVRCQWWQRRVTSAGGSRSTPTAARPQLTRHTKCRSCPAERVKHDTGHHLRLAGTTCPASRLSLGERELPEVAAQDRFRFGRQLLHLGRVATSAVLNPQRLTSVGDPHSLDRSKMFGSESMLFGQLHRTTRLWSIRVELGRATDDA